MLKWRYQTPKQKRAKQLATIMEEKTVHLGPSTIILIAIPPDPNPRRAKYPELKTFSPYMLREEYISQIKKLFDEMLIELQEQ